MRPRCDVARCRKVWLRDRRALLRMVRKRRLRAGAWHDLVHALWAVGRGRPESRTRWGRGRRTEWAVLPRRSLPRRSLHWRAESGELVAACARQVRRVEGCDRSAVTQGRGWRAFPISVPLTHLSKRTPPKLRREMIQRKSSSKRSRLLKSPPREMRDCHEISAEVRRPQRRRVPGGSLDLQGAHLSCLSRFNQHTRTCPNNALSNHLAGQTRRVTSARVICALRHVNGRSGELCRASTLG